MDSEEHADVIFLVGEEPDVQRIPAHSWVLADNSPVFRAMFRGPLASGTASPNNSAKRRRHSSATSDQDDLKYVASSLSVIEDNEDKILEENEEEVKEENGKGKKLFNVIKNQRKLRYAIRCLDILPTVILPTRHFAH